MCIKNTLNHLYYNVFEFDRLANWFQHGNFEGKRVDADYDNGSDNEIENILIELRHIINQPINLFNKSVVVDRVNFLLNEAFDIVIAQSVKAQTKLKLKEIDEIISNQVKKTKPKKTVTKKQAKINLKKAVKAYKKKVANSEGL